MGQGIIVTEGITKKEKVELAIIQLRQLQAQIEKVGKYAWVAYPDRGHLCQICTYPEGIGIADDVLDKDANYIQYVNPLSMFLLVEHCLEALVGDDKLAPQWEEPK